MSSQRDLSSILNIVDKLNNNPVSRFSYTQKAYDDNDVDSVDIYDYGSEQNIPVSPDIHPKVLDKGFRAQGASISRNGVNHFFGRSSFNLNRLVERFKTFLGLTSAAWAHNAFEYDALAKYRKGDVCYTVGTTDGVKVYAWYQRISENPETILGVSTGITEHWEVMQESTSLPAPRLLSGGENLRLIRRPGVYIAGASLIGNSLIDGPLLPPELGVCVLTVKGDLSGSVMTAQYLLLRSSGEEYTRILQGETVVVDWYKTKPLNGGSGSRAGGLLALQIENDGHLYAYYEAEDEPPPVSIDFNPESRTFGHLLWEVNS